MKAVDNQIRGTTDLVKLKRQRGDAVLVKNVEDLGQ